MQLLLLLFGSVALAYPSSSEPLHLAQTIVLPGVQGRIDHMSFDAESGRLFVAALGNNTIEVIDTKEGKRIRSISGLHEPQGVLYVPGANRLYAANGEDGTLQIFDGSSYALLKTIKLGDDADNIRYDATANRVYVGYGSGALAGIENEVTVSKISLDAHPESFRLEQNGPRIFVNLPNSRKIAVIDRKTRAVLRTGAPEQQWRTSRWHSMSRDTVYLSFAEGRRNCWY